MASKLDSYRVLAELSGLIKEVLTDPEGAMKNIDQLSEHMKITDELREEREAALVTIAEAKSVHDTVPGILAEAKRLRDEAEKKNVAATLAQGEVSLLKGQAKRELVALEEKRVKADQREKAQDQRDLRQSGRDTQQDARDRSLDSREAKLKQEEQRQQEIIDNFNRR